MIDSLVTGIIYGAHAEGEFIPLNSGATPLEVLGVIAAGIFGCILLVILIYEYSSFTVERDYKRFEERKKRRRY